MDALQRWLTLLTLVAAALAALLYMARQTWKLFQVLERITYELSPNHGASMKDDLSAVAVAVGQLQGQVRDLQAGKDAAHTFLQLQLDGLEAEIHRHHPKHRESEDA
jgi:hypothetical protein